MDAEEKQNEKKTRLALDPGVLFMSSSPTHHLLALPINLLGGLWKPKCAVMGEQMEDLEAKEGGYVTVGYFESHWSFHQLSAQPNHQSWARGEVQTSQVLLRS